MPRRSISGNKMQSEIYKFIIDLKNQKFLTCKVFKNEKKKQIFACFVNFILKYTEKF